MPFILPAGDYEAALRMAGASNFMEAFESGIDRNLRRRGQREALRQQRDLYERGLALEKGGLADDILSGIDADALARDRVAQIQQAGVNEAALADVVTAASTQDAVTSPDTSAIHAKIRENRMARRAAQGVPVVQATPAQDEQAVVAATTPIQGITPRAVSGSVPAESGWSEDDIARLTEIGFIGSGNTANMLHAARRYRASGDAATAELLERRAAMTEGGPFSDSRANARSTDLGLELPPGYRSPGRQYTQQELALGAPRPGVASGPARPVGVVTPDPDPTIREIWRAPNVVDVGSLPPEEFALATPRSQQLLTGQQKTAIEIATKLADMGRVEEAQALLDSAGVRAKAYDDLPTVTPSLQPAPQATMTPEEQEMVSRFLRGETADTIQTLGSSTLRDPLIGEETLDTAVQQFLGQGRHIDAQTIEDISERRGQVYPDAGTEKALRGGAPISGDLPSEGGVSPDGVPGAAKAAGAVSPTGSLISAAIPSMLDRALMSDAVAAGAAGAVSAVQPIPEAEPSPLDAAIATGDEAKERVELIGPEVEVSTAPVEVIDEKTGKVHTVKPGEFVYGIAKSYGASPQALIKANQSLFIDKDGKVRKITTKGGKTLAGADLIFPGEKLRIPTGEGRETGGPAGPVDTREGVKEGVLAKAEKGAKSEKEVVARLEKEQAKRTDVPLNPFQVFGRDIGYTPSLKAVAYATHMAERGDFSMINMMAGRVVKNAELPGLFARYSNFASGARRRSKEILLEEKLAKETQANEVKQRAAMGVRAMAFTQFQRAGHSLEDAQVFSGHYADMWAFDPQQARAWSTSLNAMGTELAKAEAERIKYGRKNYTGRGDRRTGAGGISYSSKDLSKAESRLDKLGKSRGYALKELAAARGISEAMLLSGDELAKMAADPIHQEMTRAYNQADARYEEERRNIKMMKEANLSQDVIDREVERAKSIPGMANAAKSVRATKKEGWGDFESALVSRFGLSNRAARGLRDYYESQGEEFYAAIVAPEKKTPPPIKEPVEKASRAPSRVTSDGLTDVLGRKASSPGGPPTKRRNPQWAGESKELYRYWKWLSAQPGSPSTRRPDAADLQKYREWVESRK